MMAMGNALNLVYNITDSTPALIVATGSSVRRSSLGDVFYQLLYFSSQLNIIFVQIAANKVINDNILSNIEGYPIS